ncbi:unnamed protein product [Effrenium voratum]|uniref:E3 ubiquitin-protein ligase n=1 Tax=Effrenium voratum TaxID=2562239 RepID=A0AA36IK66_9DINO|nr:unnamed protein product [Effrenium voratum]
MFPELDPSLQAAQHLLDKLEAAHAVQSAWSRWDADALKVGLEDAQRLRALEEEVLKAAEADLAKMEVRCDQAHRLQRCSQQSDSYCCQGCYAHSATKELEWYRCDLCDFDLCHLCLAWRARPAEAEPTAEAASTATGASTAMGPSTATEVVDAEESAPTNLPFLSIGEDEAGQMKWFNRMASQMNANTAHWELFRSGSWVPLGSSLSGKLTSVWSIGTKRFEYTANNKQKHLFDFESMEQVILDTDKKRPLRRVLWEVELDLGWFLVEDDLALRLHLNELRGSTSFPYSARGMEYQIDIANLEQVNETNGTRRKLRKMSVEKTSPKMSRQQLRMSLEDSFPQFACAVRQWLVLRWPWQQIQDCSIDAEVFVSTRLAEEIAQGLSALQSGVPQLGSILENIVWFDFVDWQRKEVVTAAQVVEAIIRDSRWRWGRAGAEDALSALWSDLQLDEAGVSKLEFLVAGGLAEELLHILSCSLDSVDDWIMEQKVSVWDGQDCGICFCPIGKGDVGRLMRCGCWLHFECLGHGLRVKIRERAVDDEQMSTCPAACGRPLGRVIPPGVVRRAVGDDLFARYLDVRVEVQWQREAYDSGRLVAKCPGCSFLVLCNEQEEMYSIKCLRQTCRVDRFCAYCSLPAHRPRTCEEHQMDMKFRDDRDRVRSKIEAALAEALFRRCTGCQYPTERINACCHMTCSHCHAQFSWVCGHDYNLCRTSHPCLNSSIYLHQMPQLAAILDARRLPRTDENGSDLFLELRCLYLLSMVKDEVGQGAWDYAREQNPELLTDIIRGSWSVSWDEVGDVKRLTRLLPKAFPRLS